MTRRYYLPDLPAGDSLVELPPTEAHHAIHVMRVAAGDEITLFDGKGNESRATIEEVGRRECLCRSHGAVPLDCEPARAIHLGIALPKPDRAREMIERLTELGVKSVTPLSARRTQRPPSDSLLEKLRRGVVEACKQCGRNQLLEILPPQTSDEYFAQATCPTRLIAHRSDNPLDLETVKDSSEISAAVGPEGGWSDDEIESAARHGFSTIDLGRRIYRVETAATVIAVLLSSD